MLSRFLALILSCAPFAVTAQYPSQTVRVVVGFPPGGATDVIGRLIASTPYLFVVHPGMLVQNFRDLIALLKKNPGKYHSASTSPGTAQHLGAEVNALIVQPATVQKFAELGAEPLGGPPEALAAFLRAEQDKWGKVIRDLNIKLQ